MESGWNTCFACNGLFKEGMTCPELSAEYALAFCVSCAPMFWKERNWTELQPSDEKTVRPMNCIGCGMLTKKVAVNMGISKMMAFCLRCRSKMVNGHRWMEFFRVSRGEDLKDYAPNKIGLGVGLTLKERSGGK